MDFGGAAVLITGGTRGLGLALGLEFARAGATVVLTYRWGSVPEEEVRSTFREHGLTEPHIIQSDASDPAEVKALMVALRDRGLRPAAIVSNVAFAQVVDDVERLKRATLELSLRYSTWPMLELLHASRDVFGRYPRYALAISTDGGAVCHPGYDMVGVAKAALETLCRYLAIRLRPHGVRVNAVRCGPLDTASLRATFGEAVAELDETARERLLMDPRAVARACVGLCCGLMDSITGQVITVDEGLSLLGPATFLTGTGWPDPFPPDEIRE